MQRLHVILHAQHVLVSIIINVILVQGSKNKNILFYKNIFGEKIILNLEF